MNDAFMHRRANAPDGKLTAHIDFMCSEHLNEALIALAMLEGFQNKSEFCRDVLHNYVYGRLDTVRLQARVGNRNPGNSGGTDG